MILIIVDFEIDPTVLNLHTSTLHTCMLNIKPGF